MNATIQGLSRQQFVMMAHAYRRRNGGLPTPHEMASAFLVKRNWYDWDTAAPEPRSLITQEMKDEVLGDLQCLSWVADLWRVKARIEAEELA